MRCRFYRPAFLLGERCFDADDNEAGARRLQKMCYDRQHGRMLTPDGLRFICEANRYDPETIGKHMLEVLAGIDLKEGKFNG